MYATNDQNVDEWVYLQNVASNCVVYPLTKARRQRRTSESSLSSISCCSSKSNDSKKRNRNTSFCSSLSSTEVEIQSKDQANDHFQREEDQQTIDGKVSRSNSKDDFIKRKILSSNSIETNTCELLNTFDSKKKERTMLTSSKFESEKFAVKSGEKCECLHHRSNPNRVLIWYSLVGLLFICPFFLGHAVARWDQPAMKTIFQQLNLIKTRLNGSSRTSLFSMDDRLTVELNEIVRRIIERENLCQNEQNEKIIRQLKILEENFTKTIEKLKIENGNLRSEIEKAEEKSPVEKTKVENSTRRDEQNWKKKIVDWRNFFAEKSERKFFDVAQTFSDSFGDVFRRGNDFVRKLQSKLCLELSSNVFASKFCRKPNFFTTKFRSLKNRFFDLF